MNKRWVILALILFLFPIAKSFSADVQIDPGAGDVSDLYGPQPNTVCVSDDVCYVFFTDTGSFAQDIFYIKTLNGGDTWSSKSAVDDSTDRRYQSFGVWYDQWTPGDNQGTLIHIVAPERSAPTDDIWYNYLDTSDDSTRGSWVEIENWDYAAASDGGGSVVKSTDGYLFASGFANGSQGLDVWKSVDDGDTWSNITPGYAFLNDDTDHAVLMPLSGGDIIVIYWDFTGTDMYSFVYDEDTDTWDGAATTIDSNVDYSGAPICTNASATCGDFGATLWKRTGDIYLALNNDSAAAGGDLLAYKYDDSTRTWSQLADIFTNIGTDGEDVKMSINSLNGDLYAVFVDGADTTRRVYYRVSTDEGTSWSGSTEISSAARDVNIVDVDLMNNERIYAHWNVDNLQDIRGNTVVDITPSIVSGTVYSDEGTAGISGVKVTVAVDGELRDSGVTDTNGDYSIKVTQFAGSEVITVFIDDETQKAVTVSETSAANLTGFDLYQSHLIIRQDDAGAITNAILSTAAASDSDISDIYSVSGGDLTVNTGYELYVWAGDEFAPGGVFDLDDLEVQGTLTLASNDGTIAGSFDVNGSGSFTTSGTILFTSTLSETIKVNGGIFNNVEFDGVGGTWTLEDDIDVNGSNGLIINNGTLDAKSGAGRIIRVATDWENNDKFTARDSKVIFDGNSVTVRGDSTFFDVSMIETTNNGSDIGIVFEVGRTQTITGTLTLNGLDASDMINLTGDVAGDWFINCTGTRNISFLDVDNSNNISGTTMFCTNGCNNGGANTDWNFVSSPVTISGTVFSGEGTTPVGAGITVALSLNGSATPDITDDTDASGNYSFTTVSGVGSGAIMTFFLDNEAPNAVTVSISDGTDKSNMDLYQDYLIVRDDDGSEISNITLDTANNAGDVDINSIYTMTGYNVNTPNGVQIYLPQGFTFNQINPVTTGSSGNTSHLNVEGTWKQGSGHALTVNGNLEVGGYYDSSNQGIDIAGGLIISAGATFEHATGQTITIAGNSDIDGEYIPSTGTLTFDGNTTQEQFLGSETYNNIIVTNSGSDGIHFSEAFTVNNFTNTTPGSTMYFLGNGTFTITNSLTLTGAASNEIYLDSTDTNRFTFDVTGGPQSVGAVNINRSNASTNNISAATSINGVNTDAAEPAPHWVFPATAAINIDVGTFKVDANTGNLSVNSVPFQPKAFMILLTKNDGTDTDSASGSGTGSMISVGMTDGSTHFCMASGSEDSVGSSDVGRRGWTDQVMCNINVASGSQNILGTASYVSMDPNGFTINRGVAFSDPTNVIAQYVAFGGDDLNVSVGRVDLANVLDTTVDENTVGFEPDLVLTSYIGRFQNGTPGANDEDSFCLGWIINPDIQPTDNVFSVMKSENDGQGTMQSASRFDDTQACTSYRNGAIDASYVIEDFDASGFTVRTTLAAATTNEIMGYMALDLGSDPQVFSVDKTTPTSTGTQSEINAKFEPIFLMGIGSGLMTSVNANTNGGNLSIGIADDSETYTMFLNDQGVVTVSNTHSRRDTSFMKAYNDAGTIEWEADLSSLDTNGWTLNYTDAASSSYLTAFLAIGIQPASATIQGRVYSDRGITAMGASVPVALSVNGGAISQTDLTDVNGDYEFTLETSANDILTVFIDGTDAKGVVVTESDGNLISDVDIYQDHLIVRNDNAASTTNSDLATADNSGDTDISDIYTMSGSNLTVPDDVTLLVESGQTYEPGGSVVCDDIEINGILTMASNNFTVSGSWDATGGSFTSSSLVTFDSTAAETLRSNESSFNNLLFNGAGSWTIQDALSIQDDTTVANGTLALAGFDVTVGGSWNTTSGTFTTSGTVSFVGTSPQILASNSSAFNHIVFAGTDGTYTLEDALDVDGDLTIVRGGLDVNSAEDNDITIAGDWNNNSGFEGQNGTVTFDGSDQTVSGTTTFNNMTKVESTDNGSDVNFIFENGQTQTITGTWMLTGLDDNDMIRLRSDSSGDQWFVDPQGTRDLSYLDVKDSNNSSGTTVDCTNNCLEGANNFDWNFLTGQITMDGTVYSDEGATNIGSGITVSLSINGASADASDVTDGTGRYSITTNTPVGAGAVVTLYLDDEAQNGVLVTVSDGTDRSGMDIYQDYLILRHDNGGSITNVNVNTANNSGDTDIDAIYTMTGNNLNMVAGTELLIPSGHAYAPGANVTAGSGGSVVTLDLDGSWIASGSHTLTVGGTFDSSGSFSGASGAIDLNGPVNISGGSFTSSSTTLSLSGTNITMANSVFVSNSGTVDFDGPQVQNIALGTNTLHNVVVTNASGTHVNFTEGFTASNFSSLLPGAQLNFQQSTTFTISDTLNLQGDGSNECFINSLDGSTRFTFNVTGGEQSVSYVNVSNSEASTNNINASNSSSGSNLDTAESAPHWVFADPAELSIAVGRFTIASGVTGVQSITSVGFRPKAYVLFTSKNATDDANSAEGGGNAGMLAVGMSDGTNQFCMASGTEDDQSTTNTGRRGMSDQVICNILVDTGNQDMRGEAAHSSFSDSGFSINIGTAFSNPTDILVEYIAFGGNDLSVNVDTVDLSTNVGTSIDVNTVGFEPDLVLTGYIVNFVDTNNNGANDDHSFSVGWAVNPTIQASNNQYGIMTASRDARGAAYARSRLDSSNAGAGWRDAAQDSGFNIENFDASGFDVTTQVAASAANEFMGFLALNLGTDPQVYTTSRNTITSTGVDREAGAPFEPIFLMGLGSALITSTDSNTVGGSLSIGMTDGNSEYTIAYHDENNADPTNTHTLTTSTQFMTAFEDDGTIDWETTLTSFDNSGWTLNFGDAASNAFPVAYLAIGTIPATATILGTVYTDEGQTTMGAGRSVSISSNGSAALQTTQTDASGAYEFTVGTSAGEILSIYLDGSPEKAVAVTVSSGGLLSDVDLYQDYLILRQDNGGSLTNANLDTADDNGDTDITDFYTIVGSNVTVPDGIELYIPSGHSYTPGGTVTADDIDIDGTFVMEANNITISGGWDSTDGVFSSTGTVTFDGTNGESIRAGTASAFNNVVMNATGGVWTLEDAGINIDGNLTLTDGTLDVGSTAQEIFLAGNWVNNATFVARSGTVNFDAATSRTLTSNSGTFYSVSFIGSGGTWVLQDIMDVDQELEIGSNATLDVSGNNYAITVAGDWSNQGTFSAQSGTVTLDGNSQSIRGSTTFFNLTKNDPANDSTSFTLTFDNTTQQNITGTMDLSGFDDDDRLFLRSDSSGDQWNINPTGSRSISYLDVKDSYNDSGTTIDCTNGCQDSVNNFDWNFSANSIAISGVVYTDEGSTNMAVGRTVSVSINGTTVDASDDTDGSGAYTINTVSNVGAGAVLTLFLDDEVENGVLVTVSDGSDLSGVDLYQDYLILRHDNNSSLNNTHLDTANNINDADINAIYTMTGTQLETTDGTELLVFAGHSYAPGANVVAGTTAANSSPIDVDGTWTATGSHTIVAYGDLDVEGAFVGATGSVDLNEGLNVSAGSFTAPTTLTIEGTHIDIANGTFTHNSGTITLDGTFNGQVFSGDSNTFNNIVVLNSAGSNVTFDQEFTTANFTSTIPGSALRFQAGSTFTITNTLTLDGEASNNMDIDSSDGSSRFTFAVTGGSQTVSYLDISNSEVDNNNINANYSTNVSNTDAGESAPHWIFSTPSALNIDVGQFTIPAGTGTIGVTGVGFQPKAFILFLTKNDSDDADSNAGSGAGTSISIGMTDGTNEFCVTSGSEDNIGTSDVGRRAFTDNVLCSIDVDNGAQTVRGEAQYLSMDGDGFTLDITVAFTEPANALAEYIAFGGNDLSATVGTTSLATVVNTSNDINTVGFEPHLVFAAYVGDFTDGSGGEHNDDSLSFGFAINPDQQASNNQFSVLKAARDNQGLAATRSRFDNVRAGTAMQDNSTDAAFEIEDFDADGFSVTTRLTGAAANDGMGYMAINLGSDPLIFATQDTAQTSTGDDVNASAKFEPIFLLGMGSATVVTANSNTQGGSISIGMTDGTDEQTLFLFDDNGPTTTATHSRTTTTQFMSAFSDSGAIDWESNLSSFDNSGWTLNYSDGASSDWLLAYLAIGIQAADPTITGTVYSDEGNTPVGAGISVALSIDGGNVVQVTETNTSGQYELTYSVAANELLTFFLDDETENAVTVTETDGNLMTGIDLYQNYLVIRNDHTDFIQNSDLDIANNSTDSDIDSIYTMTGSDVTLGAGVELLIHADATYTPNGSVAAHDIDINGTMNLESNSFTISGSWDATGGTFTNVDSTTTFTSTTSETITSGGGSFGHVTLNGIGGVWVLQDNIDINGSLTISNGTFDSNISGDFNTNVQKDFLISGSFIARNGMVTLDGTDASISGSTTFYDLTISETTDDGTHSTITFDNTASQTIQNDLVLQGLDSDDRLILETDSDGNQWDIEPQGSVTVGLIDVHYSRNTHPDAIECLASCSDLGNNTNWVFNVRRIYLIH